MQAGCHARRRAKAAVSNGSRRTALRSGEKRARGGEAGFGGPVPSRSDVTRGRGRIGTRLRIGEALTLAPSHSKLTWNSDCT
jgi:hypothetical protein